MATNYPSLLNQKHVLPASCLWDKKLDPCPEAPYQPSNMMYLNQASAASYTQLFSGSSLPLPDSVNGDSHMVSRPSIHVLDGEQSLSGQGLSLSLGTRIPSGAYVPSCHYQYIDPCHVQSEDGSRSSESRNFVYLSDDLPEGGAHNRIEMGALNSPGCLVDPNKMHSSSLHSEQSGLAREILNFQYLKAARELLDDVVNVQNALKKFDTDKFGIFGFKETDVKMNGNSSDPLESITNCSSELSTSERQDLQKKLTKLSSMLDEVDTRYKHYYHQMQIMVSSFDMVSGRGAAKPYTALARKTISRHFRSLRDAISSQIQATRHILGEQDALNAGQGVLPRLRYVGQQMRQQRTLQQFGMMAHSWRQQRGLPESSVSVLRAWLFEHFLHPYPKDSEKLVLARKTGLTRSQVANWFINARVRLWKPMVEEIYKEEFGEVDFKFSPEDAHKAARQMSWSSEDTTAVLQESVTTEAANGGQMGHFDGSKSDLIADLGMQGCTARLGFLNDSSILSGQ